MGASTSPANNMQVGENDAYVFMHDVDDSEAQGTTPSNDNSSSRGSGSAEDPSSTSSLNLTGSQNTRAVPLLDADGLTYKQARACNIVQNNEMLKALGLDTASQQLVFGKISRKGNMAEDKSSGNEVGDELAKGKGRKNRVKKGPPRQSGRNSL